MKTYFFGWTNIKWLIKEIIYIYSAKKSYFSKKRIESGIAFGVLQFGMIFWLLQKHEVMVTSDFCMWAGIELVICGYTINEIQKQKITDQTLSTKIEETTKEDMPIM